MVSASRAPMRIEDLQDWFAALIHPTTLIELAVLAGCIALAWALAWAVRRATQPQSPSILLGRRLIDGVLFPSLLLCLAYGARVVLASWLPTVPVFQVAVPVFVSLAVIRLGVKVLQAAFQAAPLVRVLERTISWFAWGGMVLWISGLLPLVLEELDQIRWKVGGSMLSVRTMIEGTLTAGVVLIIALWISSAIEARLLRKATGSELSLRKVISNALRSLLMFVGLLLALSAVGIDLTALSVLGGAIGVGIGFGLQKLAANYVSGFVVLAERSTRIGDMVRVDNFEGRVTDIKARYTVIRSLAGRESIVPNEMLLISRVENLTLADPKVSQSTVVSVGYDSDVTLVSSLLLQAALDQERVLRDPGPSVALSNFGADGLEFTVSYWIADPENGQMNLRSQINVAILQALRVHGIDIPFPQRVIHTRVAEAAGPRPVLSRTAVQGEGV